MSFDASSHVTHVNGGLKIAHNHDLARDKDEVSDDHALNEIQGLTFEWLFPARGATVADRSGLQHKNRSVIDENICLLLVFSVQDWKTDWRHHFGSTTPSVT
jgi:hypothetical protein